MRQCPLLQFLSTPSARRATPCYGDRSNYHPYFYPRPPRGGRHAPSAMRQCPLLQFLSTPSARRATRLNCPRHAPEEFLSTPSARRATRQLSRWNSPSGISIHALREEGDACASVFSDYACIISIHALREEGDQARSSTTFRQKIFLSTPSARRATCRVGHPRAVQRISIHALREEGDTIPVNGSQNYGAFLSTPSARRATSRGGIRL